MGRVYVPDSVPSIPEAQQAFLQRELQRLSDSLDLPDSADPSIAGLAVMYGGASNFTLNATASDLVNYPNSNAGGTLEGAADPVAGTITIADDGLYRLIGWCIGQQGNNTKEEWIEFRVDVGGTFFRADIFDVTTDKTDYRSVGFNLTRGLNAADVVKLQLWASAGLGTFSVENTTFEIERIR